MTEIKYKDALDFGLCARENGSPFGTYWKEDAFCIPLVCVCMIPLRPISASPSKTLVWGAMII